MGVARRQMPHTFSSQAVQLASPSPYPFTHLSQTDVSPPSPTCSSQARQLASSPMGNSVEASNSTVELRLNTAEPLPWANEGCHVWPATSVRARRTFGGEGGDGRNGVREMCVREGRNSGG